MRAPCCRADIVPSRYVNPAWAAYPPSPEKLGEVYELVRALSADFEQSPFPPCVMIEQPMRTGPMSCTTTCVCLVLNYWFVAHMDLHMAQF